MTIVGPGGVGKTSVALVAAHEATADHAWFADLAPVSDPALVATAVLETFGLAATPENMLAAVAHHLHGQSALLVLDNCEHLIEACASIAEALLGASPGLRILATSREPLRAESEWVTRLPALDIPAAKDPVGEISLESAASYSAVQLFVQRATSNDSRFLLEQATVAPVVEICRRLDGIPLALELAAANVSTLGIRGVAQRLREQLELPSRGRRTAAARQTTLSATLSWSYRLLAPAEQRALSRLAIFQGLFTVESAIAVVGPLYADDPSVLELLASLAEKSLLSVDLSQEAARYRLLQTTRSFALERLKPREAAATRSRHARELRRLADENGMAWGAGDGAQARRDSADLIDDLTAAIEWALSPIGDVDTAVDLIITAAPLRRRLSLTREHRKQVERALDQVRALSPPNPAAEMRLLGTYGLGSAFRYATRNWIIASAERLQALARELGDAEHLMVGLWDRSVAAILLGDVATLELCAGSMLAAVTPGLPNAYRSMTHNVRALVALNGGDLDAARKEVDAGLALLVGEPGDMLIARLGHDPRANLSVLLTPILWAQGFPEQALAAAHVCVDHFRRLSHVQSLMFALTDVGTHAAFLAGDLDAASTFLDEHRRLCEQRGERGYSARAQEFMDAVLRVARTGRADPAAAAVVAPGSSNPQLSSMRQLAMRIAEAVGRSRSAEDGLAAIEMIGTYVSDVDWTRPELMRVRASLMRQVGSPVSVVEPMLRQALERAAQIGAISLELRIVTTLAEFLSEEGRRAQALAMLTEVMDRMTEGYDAADYQRARSLTQRLRA